jgi:hypothetical protein
MKPSVFILIVAILISATAFAGEKQTRCPLDRNPVSAKLYTDRNGYRIYACSAECLKIIQTESLKVIRQMKQNGVEIEKAPKRADALSGATKKKKRRSQ